MRCPTTSGAFQCEYERGHAGPCECTVSEYATARLPCVIQAVRVDGERPATAEERK